MNSNNRGSSEGMIHHFILTRFCLDLWHEDKTRKAIDKEEWIKRRLDLFENYCLPSVMAQSNRNFEWILLVSQIKGVDNDWLKAKLQEYKNRCPQIKVVGVKSEAGWKFAYAFREIVRKRLQERGAKDEDICMTTYFDNDDVLGDDYIERVQDLYASLQKNTFISFDYGYQYFTELDVRTRIKYPNNHFMTLVEGVTNVRTCFGYGSHFLLERRGLAKVHHVSNKDWPMWAEVIHEGNVDNDVKMTFNTKVVSGAFGGRCLYFLRVLRQMKRRAKDKIFPRKW